MATVTVAFLMEENRADIERNLHNIDKKNDFN